jgi:PAS domain S-box-containing protein
VLIDPHAFVPENDDARRPPSGNDGMPPLRDTRVRPIDSRRSLPSLIEAFVKAASLDSLIEMIPVRAASYLNCRRVLLYEVRDEQLHMVSSTVETTARGWTSTLLRIASVEPIPLGENTPETRALQGEHVIIEKGPPGLPSRIIAPMHGLGGPVGVLVVVPTEDETAWGADGLRASQMLLLGLEDVARVAAIALESARLLTENHQRAEEMDLLKRLTNAFNSSVLDLDSAIRIVERQVSRITRVDLCAVVLGGIAPRSPVPPGRWLRTEIIKSVQVPILLDDVSMWPLAHFLPEGVRSFYAFPLFAELRVVGVLALAFRAPHVLEDNERNLLSILANTASTVLQKAGLQAQTEQARQQARDMLERAHNEERFKDAILRNIQSGILTIDLEGRVTLLNPTGMELLDLGEKAPLGLAVEEIMPIVDAGPHVVRSALGQRFAPPKREVHVRTTTGHDLTLAVTVAPLRLADGRDLGALCAFQDLTTMRALENEMRHMEQVASLGMEAKSISHDMNNIINPILMGLQEMERIVADNTQARLDVSRMLEAVHRMTALTGNMLDLAEPKKLQMSTFDVGEVLERILQLISPRAMFAHVIIERHFEPNATIYADEQRLARAIDNLCINAIEAMPKGGKLTITTRTTRAGEPTKALTRDTPWSVPIDPRLRLAGYGADDTKTALLVPETRQKAVEIVISDTGVGIPPEHLQAIWETGKSFGKGSAGHGLGLATVKQIIELHGGTVNVVSKVGQGTTFSLLLPSGKS